MQGGAARALEGLEGEADAGDRLGQGDGHHHRVLEAHQAGPVGVGEAVEERPRGRAQGLELGAPHAGAHVQDEEGVHGHLLEGDGVDPLAHAVVPHLEAVGGQPAHGLALAGDEDVHPHHPDLHPEDQGLLLGGAPGEGGGEEGEGERHRGHSVSSRRANGSAPRPGGPKGYSFQGSRRTQARLLSKK